MKHRIIAAGALAAATLAGGQAVFAQDAGEAEMMTHCNSYAARHLDLSPSEITELSYEGTRTDGTHAVNGSTSTGLTFQCSFGPHGLKVVSWYHSAPADCPADISEANRYLYPGCD